MSVASSCSCLNVCNTIRCCGVRSRWRRLPGTNGAQMRLCWARLGTPLPAEFTKADGSRYLSGTEWEYEDAMQAARLSGVPKVVVYRRMEKVLLDPTDAHFDAKLEQWQRVDAFFAAYSNLDGSIGNLPYPEHFK